MRLPAVVVVAGKKSSNGATRCQDEKILVANRARLPFVSFVLRMRWESRVWLSTRRSIDSLSTFNWPILPCALAKLLVLSRKSPFL